MLKHGPAPMSNDYYSTAQRRWMEHTVCILSHRRRDFLCTPPIRVFDGIRISNESGERSSALGRYKVAGIRRRESYSVFLNSGGNFFF